MGRGVSSPWNRFSTGNRDRQARIQLGRNSTRRGISCHVADGLARPQIGLWKACVLFYRLAADTN